MLFVGRSNENFGFELCVRSRKNITREVLAGYECCLCVGFVVKITPFFHHVMKIFLLSKLHWEIDSEYILLFVCGHSRVMVVCFILLQPIEEPIFGKEKKRRKLDEIVLGLSAAKEQQTPATSGGGNAGTSEPPKKSPASPSTNFSNKTSQPSASQLLSRSLSSTAGGKSVDLSSYFGNVDQQSFLLKQQQLFHQQQQSQSQGHKVPLPASSTSSTSAQRGKTTYEAMIADFTKGNDIAAKMNSAYSSHDAKVNEVCIPWLWNWCFSYLFLIFLV